MDELTEINTLKLTLADGTAVLLPIWFTNQYSYFKNIIEELGEVRVSDEGTEYKFFELDLSSSPLEDLKRLITKPVIMFLKRYAYHVTFLYSGEDKRPKKKTNEYLSDDEQQSVSDKTSHVHQDDEPTQEWHNHDSFEEKMILKYIDDNLFEELFQIYNAANYLGSDALCQTITDILMKFFKRAALTNIFNLQNHFMLTPEFTQAQQSEILKKFEWQ